MHKFEILVHNLCMVSLKDIVDKAFDESNKYALTHFDICNYIYCKHSDKISRHGQNLKVWIILLPLF